MIMDIEQARELVGKRVLVRLCSGQTMPSKAEEMVVFEWKVLEVSPSGEWIKLEHGSGEQEWRPTAGFNIVEALWV